MTARMPQRLKNVLQELRKIDDPAVHEIVDEAEMYWKNPEKYENGEFNTDAVGVEMFIFQFGVEFGMMYEQAYPAFENDDWPVPLEDRE